MFRQDIDPLADTIPPRHAYESDEEDEFTPSIYGERAKEREHKSSPEAVTVDININDVDDATLVNLSLIITSGVAGSVWRAGADLGNEIGKVLVNGAEMALLYRPSWCHKHALVLVSEVTSRLPIWAMHPFAHTVLEKLRPSSVVLLDIYASATYITSRPVARHESPIRILRIGAANDAIGSHLASFDPPNLLQTVSAAFMSILALPGSKSIRATLLLLPSQNIAPLPPSSINVSIDSRRVNEESWSAELLSSAHEALLREAGIEINMKWKDISGILKQTSHRVLKRTGDIGEGSMYI